jgi:DNA modification methylase
MTTYSLMLAEGELRNNPPAQTQSQTKEFQTVSKAFEKLEKAYAQKLRFDENINRMMVSFQANRTEPQFRWFKYREGFSRKLVEYLIAESGSKPKNLFDPFAGAATTLFTASKMGINAIGIELLPVGPKLFAARYAIDHSNKADLTAALKKIISEKPWIEYKTSKPFLHIKITEGAFSNETELLIGKYRAWIESQSQSLRDLLELAILGVLEEISFTRKDGQFLRWDSRAQRKRTGKFDKGHIPSFDEAISSKLLQIVEDLEGSFELDLSLADTSSTQGKMELKSGDVFERILEIESNSVEMVITSPPYLNRYDYTRTYALELAFLGIDEQQIRDLRQSLLTCTVENRPKAHTGLNEWVKKANQIISKVEELEVMNQFFLSEMQNGKLNNNGIVSMIDGYFKDSALHLAQVASRMKSGGIYYMINDNVRYNGLTIPVDLLLTRIAEEAGFACREIKVLPIGKGNSSQQMRDYGKSDIRKCIYVWEKI